MAAQDLSGLSSLMAGYEDLQCLGEQPLTSSRSIQHSPLQRLWFFWTAPRITTCSTDRFQLSADAIWAEVMSHRLLNWSIPEVAILGADQKNNSSEPQPQDTRMSSIHVNPLLSPLSNSPTPPPSPPSTGTRNLLHRYSFKPAVNLPPYPSQPKQ